MSQALTTQFIYNRWSDQVQPLSGANNSALQAMINTASDAVATRLDRTFELTARRVWLNGSGGRVMQLPHWPVQEVYGLAVSSQDCIEITNTSAVFASVYTTETGVRLHAINSAGTETNTPEITFAAQPTIIAMANAITAIGSGWSATVLSSLGTKTSSLIRPRLTGQCVHPDTFTLEIPDEFEESRMCANTERSIERRYGAPFAMGLSNIFVWFKAGYTLPVDDATHSSLAIAGDVPSDLSQAVNAIVKAMIDGSDDILGASEGGNVADYNYRLTPGGRSILSKAIEENMPALMPYRRVALGI